MHYFVTGASGFLGGYVTSHLLAGGHRVTALVRTREQAKAFAGYGVHPHLGDLLDRDSLRRGMRRGDGVFHLAAFHRYAGRRYRKVAYAVNVIGTRNVLEVMAEMGVPRGVYTSDLEVFSDTRGRVVDEGHHHDGRHLSVYAATKSEALFRVAVPMMRRGLPLVVVIPGTVYGPGDTGRYGRMMARHLRGRVPLLPTRTAVCWAHASDVAWAHLQAMERGRSGEAYVLAGPPHTLREVLAAAGRLGGRRHAPLPVPGVALRPIAGAAGLLGWVVPPLHGTAERLRTIAGVTHLGDSTKAARELGFDPRPLEEGLPDTVRALLAELMESMK
jgi:nucleoside-diphosphate-sugar epimerase